MPIDVPTAPQNQKANAGFQIGRDLGEWRAVLARPTDRQNEPVTTGLPSGPGSNALRLPNEDEAHFRKRMAATILSSPAATEQVKAFVNRYLSE